VGNDFVGYEVLIDFIRERRLMRLEGDLIEIGALLGGGTAKLARFAHEYGRQVYSVDIFSPDFDQSRDDHGNKMSDIYRALLSGRSQKEVYRESILGLANIVTIEKDSAKVRFPPEQQFVFGFIDGNHDPEYVRNDFNVVWQHLCPGGFVGFHDYGGEMLQVTETIDQLIDEHKNQIGEIHRMEARYIILLGKKACHM